MDEHRGTVGGRERLEDRDAAWSCVAVGAAEIRQPRDHHTRVGDRLLKSREMDASALFSPKPANLTSRFAAPILNMSGGSCEAPRTAPISFWVGPGTNGLFSRERHARVTDLRDTPCQRLRLVRQRALTGRFQPRLRIVRLRLAVDSHVH